MAVHPIAPLYTRAAEVSNGWVTAQRHDTGHPVAVGESLAQTDRPSGILVPFDEIFHLCQVPAYAFDPATLQILVANDAAAVFYGYDRDTFTSLTVDRIVHEEHWPVVREVIANVTPIVDREGLHQHADGHPLPVRVTARVMDAQGRPIRLVQVQDLTEVVVTRAQVQDYLRNVVSTIARTVRARDPYTHRHQERVAELAELIARGMGLSAHLAR